MAWSMAFSTQMGRLTPYPRVLKSIKALRYNSTRLIKSLLGYLSTTDSDLGVMA